MAAEEGGISSRRDLVSIAVATDALAMSTPPPVNLFASSRFSHFSSAASLLELPLNTTEEVFETMASFLRSIPSLPRSCRDFLCWALASTLLSARSLAAPRARAAA